MGYATQQDMIDRFAQVELIQITDRNNTGSIDAAVLGQALADADAAVDGYLASRYTLPLATIPKSLTRVACDIARYYLYDNAATEEVRNRYADAVKLLTALARGDITLGPDPGETSAIGSPQTSGPDRVFTQDTLGDF